jgi:hypothetical protein
VNNRFVSISFCLLFIIASVIWFGDITIVRSITPDTSLTATSYSKEEYKFGVFPPGNSVDHLQSAINLGITQPRVILSWNLFEPSKGQFKFMLYDWNIHKMHQAGMSPIVTVKSDSSWGTEVVDPSKPASSPPIDEQDYIAFLTNFVTRYKDKVTYYQIENEVYDYGRYWNGSVEEYIDLLQIASTTIRNLDEDAIIVLQGFANQVFREIEAGNEDAVEYFDMLMEQSDYFDVIDFHQYYEPGDVVEIVSILKQGLAEHGIHKELVCTEAGDLDLRLFGRHIQHLVDGSVPPVPIVEQFLSIPEVRAYLQELLEEGLTEQEWIDFAIFLSDNPESRPILEKYQSENLVKRVMITFSQGVKSFNQVVMMNQKENPVDWFFAMMGLMDSEGNHKPSYYTYKLLIENLRGCNHIEKLSEEEMEGLSASHVYAVHFPNERPSLYIAWSSGGDMRIDVSKQFPSIAKVTHIVTKRGFTDLDAYSECVSSHSIPLTNTPIIIEEW